MTYDEFRINFRLPYMDFCREYLEVDREEELGEIFKKFYIEENLVPEPINGVEEILGRLKGQEKALVVLSSHSFVSKRSE